MRAIVQDFAANVSSASDASDIGDALDGICVEIGFRYFALANHIDLVRYPESAIRVSNYPPAWVRFFEGNRLGPVDPVLRASHLTSIGFAWSALPNLINLTPTDRGILAMAQNEGIGDGYTVPAHIPGEANGSCSFAVGAGEVAPTNQFPLAQLIGGFAFEAARRLKNPRVAELRHQPPLTDRQRDCVLWAARGKSDWEISRILGVQPDTVVQHLKQARERYGVQKRTALAIRALFDGTISFTEIFKY